MRVAVTGATGYVGQFITADLLACGHTVIAWSRPETAHHLPLAVQRRDGRLDQPASFAALLEGCDALIHAAFHHVPGKYRHGEGDDPGAFLDINLHGSLALLQEARRLGVERCVVLSTRAVYDGTSDRDGGLLERDQAIPTTLYGAHKLALEAFVSAWGLGDGWHIAALRPTGIYGVVNPFARTKWLSLVRDTLSGRAPHTDRIGTEIHGQDVAKAVRLLLNNALTKGQSYNCSDLVTSTFALVERIRRLAGRDARGLEFEIQHPLRIMCTDKLRALGWRPGGERLLDETLAAMIDRLR